jgi:hypothetical protein
VTGIHEPVLRASDVSNTNSARVAGQSISNSFVKGERVVKGWVLERGHYSRWMSFFQD